MSQLHAPTLLVDLGGTNVRFAVAGPSVESPLSGDSIRRYQVTDFTSLTDATRHYMAETGLKVRRAVIAAAGRIAHGETVKITNNPWTVSARHMAADLQLDHVHLVNDFVAQSMAVTLLRGDDLARVGSLPPPAIGASDEQTFAIVGPGTGLGVGCLLLRENHTHVLQSEGGHAGFAADTAEDMAILQHLKRKFGRVHHEHLICGQGLVNIYDAICAISGAGAEGLSPEEITTRADAGSDPLCVRTLDTFVGIFGSIAGDLVLTLGAWDGVYLTGGLMPTLLPWLQQGQFRDRFEAKGHFQDILETVPTPVVLHPEPGLLGAAALAMRAPGSTR